VGRSGFARALELGALAPPTRGAFSPWEGNSQQVAAALITLAKREPIGVVEFVDYTGLGAATLRARAAGEFPADVLLTVRVHGTLGAIDAAEGVVPDEARRRMHEQEAFALRQADRVLVPTEAVGADYAARYGLEPGRIVVSPPPMAVLLDGLKAEHRLPDPLHFLFYGKLQEVKGCDILARAAVMLMHEQPELGWRFTFVGRDTFCTAHNRMASVCLGEIISPDCARGFEFVPHIARELLPEITRTVAAAVIPSRSESFCLAAHELRALGVPLIVPARPPFIEYFSPETGCLNFDGSAESLAGELRRFSADSALRRLLARAPPPSYPPFDAPYARLLEQVAGEARGAT
jgi:glycosyltransferase involved in cell wall biosynthesis